MIRRIIAIITFFILVYISILFLQDIILKFFPSEISKYIFEAIKISIIIIGWIIVSRKISKYYYLKYYKENITIAIGIRNFIQLFSYLILFIFLLIYFKADISYVLASSTVTGLILGFASQSVLSNIFSGIVILSTGLLKPGEEIRILNNNIPYQPLTFPAYKTFSKDFVYVGYRGIVLEVSLLFTKLLIETGDIIVIPNSIIISGGIVNYSRTRQESEIKNIRIRFELDYRIKFDKVKEYLEKEIGEFGKFKIYIEEVSDKFYYIIDIEGDIREPERYREIKSLILKKLLDFYKNEMDKIQNPDKYRMSIEVNKTIKFEEIEKIVRKYIDNPKIYIDSIKENTYIVTIETDINLRENIDIRNKIIKDIIEYSPTNN